MQPNYEPPITPDSTIIPLGDEPLLAPGVYGYAVERLNGEIWIPMIEAKAPGSGQVWEFINNLSPRCCIVNVISARLCTMLLSAGYVREDRDSPFGPVDVWLRRRKAA